MSSKFKVLVVDDEAPIRRFLAAGLPEDEYQVLEAETGKLAIQHAATYNPDVILLDLGLPDIDGIEVTKRIREWTLTPIIVLSARGQEQDKIAALDSGADDYLTKPFSLAELLARIRVALRPTKRLLSDPANSVFQFGAVHIDLATREVTKGGTAVHLTPIEYKLLSALIQHAGRVITHRQLLTDVWGNAYSDATHYLRVYMGQLRHKLEDDPAKPRYITTESGVGYRLRTE